MSVNLCRQHLEPPPPLPPSLLSPTSSAAAPPAGDRPPLSVDLIAWAEVAHALQMQCFEGLHLYATSCTDLHQVWTPHTTSCMDLHQV